MPLHFYADRPARRCRQLAADVAVTAWSVVAVWLAVQLHHRVVSVASVAFRLRDGAGGIGAHLDAAGGGVGQVPLVGDALASPLRSAGGAAGTVAGAGQQLGDQITAFALPLAVGLVALAVIPLAGPWLVVRGRYALRAGATTQLARSAGGTRLLALRALAHQPPGRLVTVARDPVEAWMNQDPTATAALADLELRELGLRRRTGRGS
jgi:hypothetical protein